MNQWQWAEQDRRYANFGNANQWTVNAGMSSLARESAQNSNDARGSEPRADLVYTLVRLTGQARLDVLDALRWSDDLLPHLVAMTDGASGSVSAGQIRVGIDEIQASDAIVLLKIADYGCAGLTGPEFPDAEIDPSDYGNFIKLCRLDLFSGKQEAAGGSFGLGKAVYWRFSRLQTVLFNSTLPAGRTVDGRQQRVFGVNQGVSHRMDGGLFQGRGYFGLLDSRGDVSSTWNDHPSIRRLHLDRSDDRPGTTALLVGFYDPDQPNLAESDPQDLIKLAKELRAGIEESFWPLLARGRLQVRIEVVDGSARIWDDVVDPEDTYTELVRALRRFDTGDLDSELGDEYTAVARQVPIRISRQRADGGHDAFTHQASLVVTVSDAAADPLENKVCLIRRPEMVVQTVERAFEGRTFHAFLLAGAAIHPDEPSQSDLWADDFLRFSEPPAHDRWIPGRGRTQASQANLTSRYVAPWVANLQGIETGVLDALLGLFGEPQQSADKPPQSILKHLHFLTGSTGTGGAGAAGARKPVLDIIDWSVADGRWHVTFTMKVRNTPQGWSGKPTLTLVGLDGGRQPVPWESLEPVDGAELVGDRLLVKALSRGRFSKITARGVSTDRLPIPADESAIEVVIREPGAYPSGEEAAAV